MNRPVVTLWPEVHAENVLDDFVRCLQRVNPEVKRSLGTSILEARLARPSAAFSDNPQLANLYAALPSAESFPAELCVLARETADRFVSLFGLQQTYQLELLEDERYDVVMGELPEKYCWALTMAKLQGKKVAWLDEGNEHRVALINFYAACQSRKRKFDQNEYQQIQLRREGGWIENIRKQHFDFALALVGTQHCRNDFGLHQMLQNANYNFESYPMPVSVVEARTKFHESFDAFRKGTWELASRANVAPESASNRAHQ